MNYIGYGFNSHDVKDEALLDFIRKYDPDLYNEIVNDAAETGGIDEETTMDALAETINVSDYAEQACNSVAEYIRDVLNEQIRKDHNIKSDVVQAYDQFVLFESIDFVGNCSERALLVQSSDDFVELIQGYLDIDHFDSVWESTEFVDPYYWMDD